MKKVLLLSVIASSMLYAKDNNINIGSVQLNKTVISTSGFESTTRNTVKNVLIISSEDIENKNYVTVSDVLRDVPGVTIFNNKFGNFPDLRGQGENKAKSNVQVLVDGVNINPLDPGHGVLPLDSIPASNVERIEILPGGGSVVYGDGTVGGVINIITKLKANKVYNRVGLGIGSYGKGNANLAVGHRFGDKLAVQVAYNGNRTDGYRKGNKDKSAYVETGLNYKIKEDHEVSFKYSRYQNNNYGIADLLSTEIAEHGRRWQGPSKPDKTRITKDSYNMNYQNKFAENVTFGLETSYQRTKDINGNNSDGLLQDKKTQISPKIKVNYMDKSEVVFGIDYKRQKSLRRALKPGFQMIYKEFEYTMKKDSLAGYLLNTTRMDKFEFVQGIRAEKAKYDADRYQSYLSMLPIRQPNGRVVMMPLRMSPSSYSLEKNMKNIAYELGVNYLYSDTGNVYARFESGFRTPSATQFIDKVKVNRTSRYVENNLKDENFRTFEVGMKDSFENSYLGLTLFYTETKDEIAMIGSPHGMGAWKYRNIGKTKRTGLELQAKQEYSKFSISEALTYMQPKVVKSDMAYGIDTAGKYILGVPKYTGNVTVKYDVTDNLSTSLSGVYRSGVYLDPANELGKYNSSFVADLVVNYRFGNGVKLYGGIKNLFDKKYSSTVKLGGSKVYYDPAAGRNYFAGFEYSF